MKANVTLTNAVTAGRPAYNVCIIRLFGSLENQINLKKPETRKRASGKWEIRRFGSNHQLT
jgi:hypothetical protein